jgi:methylated-DNA-[protein]-cysteine S-methyltransferase
MPAAKPSFDHEALTSTVATPLGPFSFTTMDGKVIESTFGQPRSLHLKSTFVRSIPGISAHIRSYFAGEFNALDLVPVEISASDFQDLVLRKMRGIKAGKTLSYQGLAKRSGSPRASRAVGSTCATNRIPLIIPCHRVISSDGSIGRYGYGEKRKRWLLEFEGAIERS